MRSGWYTRASDPTAGGHRRAQHPDPPTLRAHNRAQHPNPSAI